MKKTYIPVDSFRNSIEQAAFYLKNGDFERSYELIISAMRLAPDAPEPHNLLGIWFELKGDGDKARRHYRAAWALAPTFIPARNNLERICTVFDSKNPITYDFGVETTDMQKTMTINSK